MGTVRIQSTQSSPTATFYLEADVVAIEQAPAGAGYGRWLIRYYLRMSKSSGSYYGGAGNQIGYGNGAEFGRHSGNPFLPSSTTSWYNGNWDVWVNANSSGYWSGTSTTYPVQMQLVYGNINTTPSGSLTLDRLATAPGAPPAPVFNSATTTSLNFTIAQPSVNGGSAVIDYTMQVLKDGSVVGSWVGTTPTQDSSANGGLTLSKGVNYTARYYARNAIGSGPWSPSVTMRTQDTEPDQPPQPSILSTTPTTLSYFLSDGDYVGAAVTDREVQISTFPSFDTIIETKTDQFGVFSALTPGGTYYLRQRTKNAMGWSIYSTTSTATTKIETQVESYDITFNGTSTHVGITSVKYGGTWHKSYISFTI